MSKIFVILLVSLNLSLAENIFFQRLDNLLNYCLHNPQTFDSGNLLGISFAKGQLLSLKKSRKIENLILKMNKLENQFFIYHGNSTPTINQIGKLKT